MPREHPDYRDALELLNDLYPGLAMLGLPEVKALTGWSDTRTVKRRLPVVHEQVSKIALAKYMCGAER